MFYEGPGAEDCYIWNNIKPSYIISSPRHDLMELYQSAGSLNITSQSHRVMVRQSDTPPSAQRTLTITTATCLLLIKFNRLKLSAILNLMTPN